MTSVLDLASFPTIRPATVADPSAAALYALAAGANARLSTASAHDVVGWAADTFGERLVVSSSMSDGVLVHLCSQVMPGVEVLFLDTGYHFAETIATRDAVIAGSRARVRAVLPLLSVTEQDARYGPRLFERDPDACCRMRKVEPLAGALEPYLAWISGVRRDESSTRANTPVVSYDARRGKVAVHPLARWTQDDVDRYAFDNDVVVNPLVSQGYRSIGCAPCTRATAPDEDPRAGRWPDSSKSECGIHL